MGAFGNADSLDNAYMYHKGIDNPFLETKKKTMKP